MPTLRKILNPFSSSSSSSSSSHTPNTKNAPPSTELQSHNSAPTSQHTSTPLTIIELFQSQGCNSCPPANNSLLSLLFPTSHSHSHSDSHPPTTNTLLLSYEVTYWDHLGWASTFGNQRWDTRQRDYARVLDPGRLRVYTPQVLVDGGAWPLGENGWRGLSEVLKRMSLSPDNRRKKIGLEIDGEGERVQISGGEGQKGNVMVVFYEERPADVRVRAGENRGDVLRYRNVVRDLVGIGQWDGEERMFEVPERREGLEMVVLMQSGRGGEILGAVKV